MTQPETPQNPNPNTNPDPPASAASDNSGPSAAAVATATLKRPREEDGTENAEAETPTDVPGAKRRVKATNDVMYRIVVPSKQIGKVIGRSGHRIQKIREDSKATIKIADAISVSKLIYISHTFSFFWGVSAFNN